jgi:hypothetical protein
MLLKLHKRKVALLDFLVISRNLLIAYVVWRLRIWQLLVAFIPRPTINLVMLLFLRSLIGPFQT